MVSLADRLQQCYSGAVYDVMRDLGLVPRVLPRTILGLTKTMKAAGPVFTVRGRPDPDVSAHESLLAWTGLLSKAPAGHVVVCQPQDDVRALMGELSAETLKLRGVRGYIVDGGCRDTGFIEAAGYPVFCRYTTPIDIVAGWVPEAFDEPITIGNVVISPGDYILADRDGIVVIPKDEAERVVARTEEVMRTESALRQAIRNGQDPQEAYLQYGKF
ncbi:methyltransferase [Microvirga vignae]|uniref:Putative 4-hydroxy-4-methyl-2-oxoglutarate aldolase n=1 Tax=Microvirga vignae TaxID=1225564 RepID=A0A0H1RJE5_9HYPH|nr:RraA family protein [Microvirga vignae]KLK92772.1 methyltransferase [Microvirga vignae]